MAGQQGRGDSTAAGVPFYTGGAPDFSDPAKIRQDATFNMQGNWYGLPNTRPPIQKPPPDSGGAGGTPFVPYSGPGLGMNNGSMPSPFGGIGFNQNSYGLVPYLNNIRMQLLANGYYLPWLRNGGGGQ